MAYTPPQKILQRYADVLVTFALGGGKGIQKGEVVWMTVPEVAKPLLMGLRKAVLARGAHALVRYTPDSNEGRQMRFSRYFYQHANDEQLTFFPKKYYRGLVDTIDHQLSIIADTDPFELKGIDPRKIMKSSKSYKPFMDWRDAKERRGKFSWTLALYGTKEMAAEARLGERAYWNQIIKACFLDKRDPIKEWKRVFSMIEHFKKKLDTLKIEKLHIEGKDVDLWITPGKKRQWLGGRGANIPSFELFTSPDWRGTNGWIRFNQPLYRYGTLIEDIKLEFKHGRVVKARAKKNERVLKEMIKVEHADKVGEFSLTDRRLSRITKFMATTLYDENIGGRYGNTHIALGKSYTDAYTGDQARMKKNDWKKLGFNSSAVHTDIISTTDRTVIAHLSNNREKIIYKDGQFTV